MKTFYCSIILTFLRISTADVADEAKNENVKIVGGQNATKNEFPWIVNLRTNGGALCGGGLIHSSWVLTAAHCVVGASFINITAGDHEFNVRESGEQIILSHTFVVHSQYNPNNFQNDIALIRLPTPFTNTSSVAPLRLPPVSFNATGTVTVAGWGVQMENGTTASRFLQKVDLNITSYANCSNSYGAGIITRNMICASAPGKDSCQGDSGGPLICPSAVNSREKYFCGIVSFGIGCARPGYPGVYTNVASYLQWIQDSQDGKVTTTPRITTTTQGNGHDKIICSAAVTIASIIISFFVR